MQLNQKSKDLESDEAGAGQRVFEVGSAGLSQVKPGTKGKGKEKASVDMITGKSTLEGKRSGRRKGTKNKGKEKEKDIEILSSAEEQRLDNYEEVIQLDEQEESEFAGLHRMDEDMMDVEDS